MGERYKRETDRRERGARKRERRKREEKEKERTSDKKVSNSSLASPSRAGAAIWTFNNPSNKPNTLSVNFTVWLCNCKALVLHRTTRLGLLGTRSGVNGNLNCFLWYWEATWNNKTMILLVINFDLLLFSKQALFLGVPFCSRHSKREGLRQWMKHCLPLFSCNHNPTNAACCRWTRQHLTLSQNKYNERRPRSQTMKSVSI